MNSPEAARTKEHFDHDTRNFVVTVLHEHGEYRHLRFQRPGERWGSIDIHTWPGGVATSGDMADGWMFERGLNFFGGTHGPNLGYWSEKLNARLRGRHMSFSPAILRQTLAEVPDGYDIPDGARHDLITELTELADRLDPYGSTEEAHEELREFSFDYDDELGLSQTLRFEEYYDMGVEDYDFHFVYACLALNTVANLLDASSDRVIRTEATEPAPAF